jgi:hypothetical protein
MCIVLGFELNICVKSLACSLIDAISYATMLSCGLLMLSDVYVSLAKELVPYAVITEKILNTDCLCHANLEQCCGTPLTYNMVKCRRTQLIHLVGKQDSTYIF